MAEIEPATLWVRPTDGAMPRGSALQLARLAALPQSTILHGVGFPIGGTLCDQTQHTPEFRHWADALAPPWVSEHLSVLDLPTAEGPACCGFLMPPVQSEAGVRLAARNIRERARRLARPFAFETGVNYFPPCADELPDGEFFAAVAAEADCGVLLDLANLWVNDRNGRARVEAVLGCLPLDRIWEVHLARPEFAHGYWLDAHSGALDPGLVDLARDLVADLPNLGAVIFEVAPDRAGELGETGFLAQIETLQSLWEAAGSGRSGPLRRSGRRLGPPRRPSPQAWEAEIARRLLPMRRAPATETMGTPSDDDAFELYARLILAFRKGAVDGLLENTITLMVRRLGEPAVSELFATFAAGCAPSLFPSDEALAFGRFLRGLQLDLAGLDDLLAFETGIIAAAADGRPARIPLKRDIEALLEALAADTPLELLPLAPSVVEIGASPAASPMPV